MYFGFGCKSNKGFLIVLTSIEEYSYKFYIKRNVTSYCQIREVIFFLHRISQYANIDKAIALIHIWKKGEIEERNKHF